MRFLLDEMVPNAVGDFLIAQGHEVVRVRDQLLPGSPDTAVVAQASQISASILTWNRKHYRHLVSRDLARSLADFPNAGLISFVCRPPNAVTLLDARLHLIEQEFRYPQGQNDQRVIIEIRESGMMIW